MRFKLGLTFFFLLFCRFGVAQKRNVYFVKNNGIYVTSRDSADYIRIVSEPDSGSLLYNVMDVYPNGKRKFIGKSSTIYPIKLEGQGVSYYATGVRKILATFEKNQLIGPSYEYYPNGKLYMMKDNVEEKIKIPGIKYFHDYYLIIESRDSIGKALVTDSNGYFVGYDEDFKYVYEEGLIKNGKNQGDWKGTVKKINARFKEHYEAGKLIMGSSTDSAGHICVYTERTVDPQFKGGANAFGGYLARNIRYPVHAKENGIQGNVFFTFIVGKDGMISDLKILSSPSKDLSQEGLNVLSKSPNWLPDQKFGMPVNVQYTVPINFTLAFDN